MNKKLLIIIIVELCLAASAYGLILQITDPKIQEVQQQKLNFFVIAHLLLFVSVFLLIPIQEFYHHAIWAFVVFSLIALLLFYSENKAKAMTKPISDDDFLLQQDERQKSQAETAYLSAYNVVYIYSVIGACLVGLFILLTETAVCWYNRIVNHFMEGFLIRCTYDETSKYSECSICLVQFVQGDVQYYQIKACKHVFHEKCLTEWIHYNKSCPLCRTNIFGEGSQRPRQGQFN